jgi:Zn-finger protein
MIRIYWQILSLLSFFCFSCLFFLEPLKLIEMCASKQQVSCFYCERVGRKDNAKEKIQKTRAITSDDDEADQSCSRFSSVRQDLLNQLVFAGLKELFIGKIHP